MKEFNVSGLLYCIAATVTLALLQGCGDGEIPGPETSPEKQSRAAPDSISRETSREPGDLAYRIEGRSMQLADGVHRSVDGVLTLFKTVKGDIDGDGRTDLAAILRLNSSGSGVFYHLNVLLDNGQGSWQHAGETFLGEGIKFDDLAVYGEGSVSSLTGVPIHPADYGQVVAGFYMHAPNQSFADEPGLFITRHWEFKDGAMIQLENY